jgi:putative chitinase
MTAEALAVDQTDLRPVLMRLKERRANAFDGMGWPVSRGNSWAAGEHAAGLGAGPRSWAPARTSAVGCGPWDSAFELEITPGLLARLFPGLPSNLSTAYASPMNLYLSRYKIDSVCRMSAFFGQLAVESHGLRRTGENLYYTTEQALQRAFGKRIAEAQRQELLRAPQKLANRVYSGRLGNGDEASGDGWAFRGRGLIQLTGRANYEAFSKATGVGAVANPELLDQPSVAVLSACWFWHQANLNDLADTGQFEPLTRRINTAALHLQERKAAAAVARRELRIELLWGVGP